MMEIGKLYLFNQYYWILFPYDNKPPTKVISLMTILRVSDVLEAEKYSYFFSEYFKCNVSFTVPSSLFMLLEQDGNFYKILSADEQIGWIYLDNEWMKDIEEAYGSR